MTLPIHTTSPLPEPPEERPTIWAPLDAASAGDANHTIPAAPELSSQSDRNTLALVSLISSVIFPLAVISNILAAVAQVNHWPQAVMIGAVVVGSALGILNIFTMFTAIATGHVALVIAKRFARRAARRWMAILGLVVGYLSLLAYLSVIGLFVIAGLNGF